MTLRRRPSQRRQPSREPDDALSPTTWIASCAEPSRPGQAPAGGRLAFTAARARARASVGRWRGCRRPGRGRCCAAACPVGGRGGPVVGTPVCPSRISICQPRSSSRWAWTLVWWRVQSSARLSIVVGPPRLHQTTWWASHRLGGAVQPGHTQPWSRAASAVRWAGVARRPRDSSVCTRPRSSRVTRSTTASHTSRARVPSLDQVARRRGRGLCGDVDDDAGHGGADAGGPRRQPEVLGGELGHGDQRVGAALAAGAQVGVAVLAQGVPVGLGDASRVVRNVSPPAGSSWPLTTHHAGGVGDRAEVAAFVGVLVEPVGGVRGEQRRAGAWRRPRPPAGPTRWRAWSARRRPRRGARARAGGGAVQAGPGDVDVLAGDRAGGPRRTERAQVAGRRGTSRRRSPGRRWPGRGLTRHRSVSTAFVTAPRRPRASGVSRATDSRISARLGRRRAGPPAR